jgi:hypothetical protein
MHLACLLQAQLVLLLHFVLLLLQRCQTRGLLLAAQLKRLCFVSSTCLSSTCV